jgi:hypothetical protein
MANYGADGSLPVLDNEPGDVTPPEPPTEVEADSAPDPWYRNRVLLALWALLVAILVTLIIYGIVELSRGGGGGGPSTSTSSTTHPRSSTTSSTTTTTPSTTTEPPPPPPETPEQTPEEVPPPPPSNYSPPPAEPPHHHHHLPHIPSTITLPHTVITLPPGF